MMKRSALVLALMIGGAAIAQTSDPADTSSTTASETALGEPIQADAYTATPTSADMSAQPAMTPASGSISEPSNANPERDARGIAVISAPAMVPAGWNGAPGTGMGGPLVDPSDQAAEPSYPACSATVTDNCLQTYERGRSD